MDSMLCVCPRARPKHPPAQSRHRRWGAASQESVAGSAGKWSHERTDMRGINRDPHAHEPESQVRKGPEESREEEVLVPDNIETVTDRRI